MISLNGSKCQVLSGNGRIWSLVLTGGRGRYTFVRKCQEMEESFRKWEKVSENSRVCQELSSLVATGGGGGTVMPGKC